MGPLLKMSVGAAIGAVASAYALVFAVGIGASLIVGGLSQIKKDLRKRDTKRKRSLRKLSALGRKIDAKAKKGNGHAHT
jgi:putative Mn2+ efflux pump MntP